MPTRSPHAQIQTRATRQPRHDYAQYHAHPPTKGKALIYNMSFEGPGGASFAGIGGLREQVRDLRVPTHSVPRSTLGS
jgi:hypothetical protein